MERLSPLDIYMLTRQEPDPVLPYLIHPLFHSSPPSTVFDHQDPMHRTLEIVKMRPTGMGSSRRRQIRLRSSKERLIYNVGWTV